MEYVWRASPTLGTSAEIFAGANLGGSCVSQFHTQHVSASVVIRTVTRTFGVQPKHFHVLDIHRSVPLSQTPWRDRYGPPSGLCWDQQGCNGGDPIIDDGNCETFEPANVKPVVDTAVENALLYANGTQVGLYPIVASQYSSTTLYQVSYHIQ
jgi:hypothetical protein